jgi:AraC family transcriptional regulator
MVFRGKNDDNQIPQLWGEFGPRMSSIENVVNPQVCYGVVTKFDQTSHEFEYVAAMEVIGDADLPAGMERFDLPEAKYAVFTCTLPTIGEAYGFIDGTWLPQSGHRRTGGPEFELYDERFSPEDPSSEMEIYIPIQ